VPVDGVRVRQAEPVGPKHEVYAYGVVAPSTLIEVEGGYPPEGGYAELRAVRRSFGGEAAGSAFSLARLGIPTRLAGTRLGRGAASQWVVETLSAAGVDCRDVVLGAGSAVEEYVVSSGGDRTIFGGYGRMLAERRWEPPSRAAIAESAMVCLDPFFGESSEAAARWSRVEGVPYVTVDSAPDAELARHAEALIVSREFADRTFGVLDPTELFEAYSKSCRGLIVLTRGSGSTWYGRPGRSPRRAPAFVVDPIDTAGAGDSFRAGVIRGLLRGDPDDDIIRSAAAVAAIVCTTSPGVLGSPTESDLRQFLGTHRSAAPRS
jgi:sugar/nucleoside kinase (ribokinase family)